LFDYNPNESDSIDYVLPLQVSLMAYGDEHLFLIVNSLFYLYFMLAFSFGRSIGMGKMLYVILWSPSSQGKSSIQIKGKQASRR